MTWQTKNKMKTNPEQILTFGEHGVNNASLLVETAKACYVMSRPILNAKALWYIPAALFVMHHSLESFIKAFLIKENIQYEIRQKGHKLTYLLSLKANNSKNLDFFKDILKDQNIKTLLVSLEDFYNKNKYWEAGFNIKKVSAIDAFDKLISIFTERFHKLYGNARSEASIYVLEELADMMERDRKYPITLCTLPKNSD